MTRKSTLFIASSTARKEVAASLAARLDRVMRVRRWWNEFPPGGTTIERLAAVADEVDFALCLFGTDDVVFAAGAGSSTPAPRDNVVLEAGMFLKTLGLERCMILNEQGVKIPSDLDGVSRIVYTSDNPGLASAAKKVKSHVARLGPISGISAHGDGDVTISGTTVTASRVVNRAGNLTVSDSLIDRSRVVNSRPQTTLSISDSAVKRSELLNESA